MPTTTWPTDLLQRLTADAQVLMARYPQPRSALLPMLHLVQSEEGYVSPAGIAFCADQLDLTTAEVAAVATFYTQYKRHPNGEYTVGVCTNTLCAVMGGDAVFDELSRHLGVGHDETTPDGAITLERVECNAACDYAPVVMVNWEFFDEQTPASAVDLVERLRRGEHVAPTRGAAKVCTFRQVSRVLAGFSDGRADEGVGAGPRTLVGLELARRNGWEAPAPDEPTPAEDEPEQTAPSGSAPAQYGAPSSRDGGSERGPLQTETSSHDAPAAPEGDAERAGTTAGKPEGEATETGTQARPHARSDASTDARTDATTDGTPTESEA